jgi:hypothetical protein
VKRLSEWRSKQTLLFCEQPEAAEARGTFSTNYRPKVLFTKKVTLKTSKLPRWKPKNIIGLRAFEEEDT